MNIISCVTWGMCEVMLVADALLHVSKLHVEYAQARGKVLQAVNDVSFELGQAAILGIVGESGCGKSSLARAILQLEAYRGAVSLQGCELGLLNGRELRRARRNMQAVFQDPLASLNPRMTVADIVAEPLRLHKPELGGDERMEKVCGMLVRAGLDAEIAQHYPHELSGGQCQRVGIARAVICEPKLLVCDEPVSALDTSVRGQILGLLATLRRDLGIGIIFIAHDMTAVRYLCDDVLVMKDGSIVELAPRDIIFDAPQQDYTRQLLEAVLPPDPDQQPPRDKREKEPV